jgi:hypothetical protein
MLKNKKFAIGFICVGLLAIVAALVVVIARPAAYSTEIPRELDDAVTACLFRRENVSLSDIEIDGKTEKYAALPVSRDGYECLGEGHTILGYRETKDGTEVYALCSVTGYGFRNGMLVDNYGYSCVPTLITFSRTEEGGYRFLTAREGEDGAYFASSVKKMFPAELAAKAIDAQGGGELFEAMQRQCDGYAEAYLRFIGREAKVSHYHDEDFETLSAFGVSDDVCNELLALRSEFGLYLGNFEELEEDGRFLYSVKWDGNENGVGTVTYTKTNLGTGKVVSQYRYSVDGERFKEIRPKKKK